jgi:hypothetical protein
MVRTNLEVLLTEAPPFYSGYLRAVPEGDWVELLTRQAETVRHHFVKFLPEQQIKGYAPGKWSPKELLGHLNDVERVFQYRMLALARADQSALPGFDEDAYVLNGHFQQRSMEDLMDEFGVLRESTLFIVRNLQPSDWPRMGTANGNPVSLRALVAMTIGHVEHHLKVLGERYPAG